jgi:hypothetical protein
MEGLLGVHFPFSYNTRGGQAGQPERGSLTAWALHIDSLPHKVETRNAKARAATKAEAGIVSHHSQGDSRSRRQPSGSVR